MRDLTVALRVMTWNVWWRYGPWAARHCAIIDTIGSTGADIVGLQEVWADEAGENQAHQLAAELGYSWTYAPSTHIQGFAFGNAVLSRWPILETATLNLPGPPDSDFGRVAVMALVEAPGGPVPFFTTHLTWEPHHSALRCAQVRALAAFIAGRCPGGAAPILTGDLNAPPESDAVRMLTGLSAVPSPPLVFQDAWESESEDRGLTFTRANPYNGDLPQPSRRVDYVLVGVWGAEFVHRIRSTRLAGVDPIAGVQPSDHYAVVADLARW